ncbi:C2 domain containing protein [Histomonas meleagridis]|uniref:C2 domain containing protein n=1 Tax=Histomonas meleagridis TaxID=135588 RepID=UPI00355A1584|nr:C2 domain containing protein [Histomonas meleagridis]KAH0805974.1 C2 domain containing protein [Histomonas meleagridis]
MPKHILVINVIEARSLSPSDLNGWSDPFCRVYLGKKKIGQTKYISRTLNPRWNETFRFKYDDTKRAFDELLRFEIYDHDAIGPHDILGQYQVDLSTLLNGKWIEGWFKLKDEEYKNNVRGYVRLKLQFVDEGQDFFREEDRNSSANMSQQRILTEEQRTQTNQELQNMSQAHSAQRQEQIALQTSFNKAVISQAQQQQIQQQISPDTPFTLPQGTEIPQAPQNPQYSNVPTFQEPQVQYQQPPPQMGYPMGYPQQMGYPDPNYQQGYPQPGYQPNIPGY